MSSHASSRLFLNGVILLFLALSVFAAGYWFGRQNPPAPLPVSDQTIFQRTIDDAKNVSENDISDQLWAINAGSPNIVWQDTEGESPLKVVTWMSEAAYQRFYLDKGIGKGDFVTGPESADIWVTLVPQLREFCQRVVSSISDDNVRARFDPAFRLKQYMGLNPHYRYERFVELWVNPDDLFRPCPDPETDDHACTVSIDEQNPPRVKGIEDYRTFFQQQFDDRYQPGPYAAPWTRLGYTYDWVRGVRNVGASEFILVPNARYQVDESYATAEYCGL